MIVSSHIPWFSSNFLISVVWPLISASWLWRQDFSYRQWVSQLTVKTSLPTPSGGWHWWSLPDRWLPCFALILRHTEHIYSIPVRILDILMSIIFLSSAMILQRQNIKTSDGIHTNRKKGVGLKCWNQLIEPKTKFFKITDYNKTVGKKFNTSSVLE